MPELFNAYIDEAGDEGIRRGTRWFILSAVIVKDSLDLTASRVVEKICRDIGLQPGAAFHWRDHRGHCSRRLYAARLVAQQPIQICYVCVDTRQLQPANFRNGGHQLYRYFCRFLIERVTWLVADLSGRVRLVFSNRARFSYDQLRAYIRYVQQLPGNQIRPVIDAIEARRMEDVRFLQIADICAGAAFAALEPDNLGITDERPLLTVAPLIYRRHTGSVFSYGWKLFPEMERNRLYQEYPWMQALERN